MLLTTPCYRCRRWTHSVNVSPNVYQTEKPQNMRLTFFSTLKEYYKHVMDLNQKFLAFVIPKAWKYTVLMEAHDKLGHQGATHTYCFMKSEYYWKGKNKEIRKYIANCTLCHRENAKVQSYLCKWQRYRRTIWQNSHRLGNRMWNLHFRQQAYSYHHLSSHRMARSLPHTRQVSGYYSVHIH